MKTANLIATYNNIFNDSLTLSQAIAILNTRRCNAKTLRAFYKSNNGFNGRAKKYYLNAFKFDK